jgi:catechol 2,3-dioxygenase-like lactoylglutathione lyase family enzyme
MPLGHLGINVPDLVAAKAYYDQLMPALGYEPFLADDDQFAYWRGPDHYGCYVFFYPALEPGAYSRDRTGLQHLAFIVPTRADVDAAHTKAIELGSEVLHEPQPWPQYTDTYYAAFWLDPHGFMLEAVCHHDR